MPTTRSKASEPSQPEKTLAREEILRHEQPPRSPSIPVGSEVSAPSCMTQPSTSTPRPPSAKTQTDISKKPWCLEENRSDSTLRPVEQKPIEGVRTSESFSREPCVTIRSRSTIHSKSRARKRALKAQEEMLKIKLQLAEVALRRAEESAEDTDYDDDAHSRSEYVRSWLQEDAPSTRLGLEPRFVSGHLQKETHEDEPQKEVPIVPRDGGTAELNELQKEAPMVPRVGGTSAYIEPQKETPIVPRVGGTAEFNELQKETPLVPRVGGTTAYIETQKEPFNVPRVGGTAELTVQSNENYLKPFITELTSAIAALADRKPMEASFTSSYPSASKVIMTLPVFGGSHTEWLSFKAIYDTTKMYFNDIENTARLRRSLKGRALEIVSSELIANAQPEHIIRELELQFGRPDSIAQSETDKLRALPRCTEAPKDICTFASRIRSSVVTLQALKKNHYLMNAELLRILTDKLPNSLRVQWYRTYTEKYNSTPDLASFSEYVTEYARYCSAFAPAETIRDNRDNRDNQPNRRVPQRAFTATERQTEDKITRKCRICDSEGHYASNCETFIKGNSDKRWDLAKKHKLCFRCLKFRHSDHRCQIRKCGVDNCPASHHRLLHYSKQKPQEETVASSFIRSSKQAFLKIAPVKLSGPAGEILTYALLDDGSTISLIDRDIAAELGARGKTEPFTIKAIGDTAIDLPDSRRVEVYIGNPDGTSIPLTVRTVPKLQLSSQTISETDIEDCEHLADIKDQLVYTGGTPKVLIGQDNWHLLISSHTKRGPRQQPVASLTALGWVLHGSHSRALGHSIHFINRLSTVDDSIDRQLKEYFAIESLLINPRRPKSDPEQLAANILENNTVQLTDGRIQTALLWKKDDDVMPDSYNNAVNRLTSIERKLDRNSDLKSKYTEQIELLIQKGYAEEAPKPARPGKTWYLPHFDVHNPSKPDKLRIVHDAAAKSGGKSLNDFLLTGPDLLQSLPGVMMRFRRHQIAVSADITEMFMQVQVRPEDRDALRYLWRGNRREGAPDEYRMKSIIFGAASSPCTAIFAKNWNAKQHSDDYPEAVNAIVNHHYMDDYLDSFPNIEEAIRITTQVRDIHRKAKFELRKWVSNSVQLKDRLENSPNHTECVNITSKAQEEKILGLIWDPQTDTLSFNLKLARLPDNLVNKTSPTKREALKIIMSLYDPLGLASPVTVRAKQILQEAWRLGTDWDEPLDEKLSAQWSVWTDHLQALKFVRIPRCYPGYTDRHTIQMHVFSDASEAAYAAAIYWRTVTHDGQVKVSLVTAKARVTPLKLTSIPRLELQAAVMGTRLATAVTESHRIQPDSITYWSDSKTVLTWLRKGSRIYKPFVAHRIAAIEDSSKVEDWRWLPSKSNIADSATRDVPANFTSDHEWYNGPAFLYKDATDWPTEKPLLTEATGEERVTTATDVSASIIDVTRFSSWEKLLRTTARVLQFIDALRKPRTQQVAYKRTIKNREKDPDWRHTARRVKVSKGPVLPQNTVPNQNFKILTAEYLHKAELQLVKCVQNTAFKRDIERLKNQQEVPLDSRLRKLRVELADGVIVLTSRISATQDVSEAVKRPPILDGGHTITQLYIDWTHRKLHHSGTETVINEVRQHYWVLRLRPTTRSVLHLCLQCRIRKVQPPEPATGDHPKTRLAHHRRPFTYTGLDYFGPLSVTIGRQHQKRYVALFTCLTSRAVHLEVAASLSADSAILALRRFAARRGCPAEIYSDNGTNMHGADREMREALSREAAHRGIVWRFITPAAPFMGGVWERLVRCVKTALTTVLHERHPHEEVLSTLLCEVEYTVNSRPLTHVSVSPEDDEAITPNHILLGGSSRLSSLGEFDSTDIDHKKQWRRAQALADMFWRRWVREYLPELQHRREPHGSGPRIEVGDPVLIADGQLPRNTWPRGRVTAVYPGADGQVRTVEVRTAGGVLKRPTKKIVPLPK